MIPPFAIAADDPMLEGHFPGQPVVPGVVLLDRAIGLLAREGIVLAGPVNAKFLRPVLPEQNVHLTVKSATPALALEASVDGVVVMRVTATRSEPA